MNAYVDAIKRIVHKEDFDFDRPDIDLYNFHPQLRILLAANGVFFNNRDSKIRFVWPLFCIGTVLAGVMLEITFIRHYLAVEDYSNATECFCYFVILGSILMVFTTILFNKDNLHFITDRMNYDFRLILNLESRYRESFLKAQLQIWEFCCAWLFFCIFVCCSYIMMPVAALCYQSLFATQDENTVRPLQFPMWLPHDDPYRTPNYEIFLFLQSFLIFCVTQTFVVYIYTLFHILLHYYILMDMIIMHFEVIFDGLEESAALLSRYDERRMETQLILNRRVGNIVTMHLSVFQAVKTVSSVYGPVLVYQIMFSSIAICLIAFQIAEKLDTGTFDVLFFLLGVAATLQIWIPCYLGTMLRNKAFAVGDACWNCGWHETSLGLLVRSDIIIIIMRAQQPVTIKFTGLPNVELETFSSVMSKSYSYFNMLRQYS